MNSDTTIQLISLALDASAMRQTAIASNIAHSNTQNYKAVEVNFEQKLSELSPNDLSNESISNLQAQYQISNKPNAIDEQLLLNVQNMTHYRALVKGLNQKLAIMKIALQGSN